MKGIWIILFILIIHPAIGQQRIYNQIHIQPDTTKYVTDSLEVFEMYALDGFTYLFGWNTRISQEYGLKMVIKNEKGFIIYESDGQMDSFIFRPSFYKSNKEEDPLLLFVETGTEYSWGNTCYRILGDEIKELGHIDVAVSDTLDHVGNIMPYTTILTEGNTITIEFTAEKIVYNPGGSAEMIYDGSEIIYQNANGKLSMIEK